jgi:hypothetical protein
VTYIIIWNFNVEKQNFNGENLFSMKIHFVINYKISLYTIFIMPTFGSLWYGSSVGFPGFLYKKGGCSGRRSTNFGAGGSLSTNRPQYIENKYVQGGSGIGASSISNRRAKNRLAAFSTTNGLCNKQHMNLGLYSSNPNGIYRIGGQV